MCKFLLAAIALLTISCAGCSPETQARWDAAREERRKAAYAEARAELADDRHPDAEWSVGSAVGRKLASKETGDDLKAMADIAFWDCGEGN